MKYFFLVWLISSYEKFCYSNFYSPKAANIQFRSVSAANSFVEGAYRLTVYNTFEHTRKRIGHQLKRKPRFIDNQNLLSPYEESAKKTLYACGSSLRHLLGTDLRLEGYFEIPSPGSPGALSQAASNIKRLPRGIRICSTPENALRSHLLSTISTLALTLTNLMGRNDSEEILFFIALYSRFVDGFFC